MCGDVTIEDGMEEVMIEEDDTILMYLNNLVAGIKQLNGCRMGLSGREAGMIDDCCNKIMERVEEIKTKEVVS
jgi:hypothetical protein